MKKYICLLFIATIAMVCCAEKKEHADSRKELATGKVSEKELMNILNSREGWDTVDPSFKRSICNRLNSKGALEEFVDLIERYEILENNIAKYDTVLQDEDWFFFQLSVTLTSGANYFGEKKEFDLSRKFGEFAVKFNPDYLPAYGSLALAYCYSEDKDLALAMCKKARTLFKGKTVKDAGVYKIRPGYVTLTPKEWQELEELFQYVESHCQE